MPLHACHKAHGLPCQAAAAQRQHHPRIGTHSHLHQHHSPDTLRCLRHSHSKLDQEDGATGGWGSKRDEEGVSEQATRGSLQQLILAGLQPMLSSIIRGIFRGAQPSRPPLDLAGTSLAGTSALMQTHGYSLEAGAGRWWLHCGGLRPGWCWRRPPAWHDTRGGEEEGSFWTNAVSAAFCEASIPVQGGHQAVATCLAGQSGDHIITRVT